MSRSVLSETRDSDEESFDAAVVSLLGALNQQLLEAHARIATRQENELKVLRDENQELRRRLKQSQLTETLPLAPVAPQRRIQLELSTNTPHGHPVSSSSQAQLSMPPEAKPRPQIVTEEAAAAPEEMASPKSCLKKQKPASMSQLSNGHEQHTNDVDSGDLHADEYRSKRLARIAQQLQVTNERKTQEILALRALIPRRDANIDDGLGQTVSPLSRTPPPENASRDVTPPPAMPSGYWETTAPSSSSVYRKELTLTPQRMQGAKVTFERAVRVEEEEESRSRKEAAAAEEARRLARVRKELAEQTRRENAERRRGGDDYTRHTEDRMRSTLSSIEAQTSTRRSHMYHEMLDEFDRQGAGGN